jgi:hypothetical protein
MKNKVTLNEIGVLLAKAVRKLSTADRKRLGELLMDGLKTPVGGLKKKSELN